MPDPFEALHTPVTPVDPDPGFATRLRARVERALALPKGVPVSTIDLDEPVSTTGATITSVTVALPTEGAAIPYLAVRDGHAAIDWYVEVLGARLVGDPIVMDDGRVGHAELALGTGVMYLAEEFPEIGHVAPLPNATSVSLVLHVADVDATVAAAVAAGGVLTREVGEGYGHRGGTVVDPFGHRWMLQTPLELPDASESPAVSYRHGDIVYSSLWVPDVERAATFYGAVLGWRFEPIAHPQSRHVAGATPSQGMFHTDGHPTTFACYGVDDLAAALERVRVAGGVPGTADVRDFGLVADCVDDQGTPFALFDLPAQERDVEPAAPRPVNGVRHGDLCYLTLQVRDTGRARAFYGSVLGWEFTAGRVDDGWEPNDVAPMTGMHGGHDVATGVPMYRVDDVATAVERVRAGGGTSTDPERQPYGISAECTDDQGAHFYLGQL